MVTTFCENCGPVNRRYTRLAVVNGRTLCEDCRAETEDKDEL